MMTMRLKERRCSLVTGAGVAWLAWLGTVSGAEGEFVVPAIRANGGTLFSYWDRFVLPPGTVFSYNVPHYPNVLGQGDAEGNPSNYNEEAVLFQVRSETAFLTGSGAIYDYRETVGFEVRYRHTGDAPVTNVIFQVQTGGLRFDLNDIRLLVEPAGGGAPERLVANYKALDDPGAGGFTDRLVSGFQWDLTGRDVRDFVVAFHSPGSSMPLYEAQLDVVVGAPFERQLGILMATGTLPLTVWGVPGYVYRDLPADAEQRFFLPGDTVPLVAEAVEGYQHAGWLLPDGTISDAQEVSVEVGEEDLMVRAIFSPASWEAFREHSFSHGIPAAGEPPQHTDDAISGPDADPDGDGLTNFQEYVAGGNPLRSDAASLQPRPLTVTVDGKVYPAIEFERQAAEPGDLMWRIEESSTLGSWEPAETVEVSSRLTVRGTRRDTVRRARPADKGPVFLRVIAVKGEG